MSYLSDSFGQERKKLKSVEEFRQLTMSGATGKAGIEKVKGTLEEVLSLLDDACIETEGLLKVELHEIWNQLDELMKRHTY